MHQSFARRIASLRYRPGQWRACHVTRQQTVRPQQRTSAPLMNCNVPKTGGTNESFQFVGIEQPERRAHDGSRLTKASLQRIRQHGKAGGSPLCRAIPSVPSLPSLCKNATHFTRSAAPRSAKNCRPNWQYTTPNEPSGNGSLSALASCHCSAALEPASVDTTDPATLNIPGLRSIPTTAPVGPTRLAAVRATTPVPQATSKT